MEGKGRESHRGCLLPCVDRQEMGRCGSQVARRGGWGRRVTRIRERDRGGCGARVRAALGVGGKIFVCYDGPSNLFLPT
jgi:hypothetical protein